MVSVARDLREAWRRTYARAGRKPERRVEQSEGSGLTLMRMNVLVLRTSVQVQQVQQCDVVDCADVDDD